MREWARSRVAISEIGSSECMPECARSLRDTAEIVRDGDNEMVRRLVRQPELMIEVGKSQTEDDVTGAFCTRWNERIHRGGSRSWPSRGTRQNKS
jgi:hypothetical protein